MILKIGTITRRKVLAMLLTAAMLFSLLPAGLTAAEEVGATLIQSGDYTISADGIYQLANGYSGIITIAPGAYGVTVIGSADGKNHPNTSISVAERPLPLQLIIEDLKISAPDGKPGIDFGNAPGINYTNWPFKLNNAEQPAPYSLANLFRFGGDCSVTGGGGRAGVFVGDGLWLTIDKLPHLTDAQARLTAVGGGQGAGIGGDRGFSGGSVTINGGTITASGGDGGAGLGNLAGAITINGGTITATGGWAAPGLGNTSYTVTRILERYNLKSSPLVIPGETIIINGGTVTAVGNGEAGIYAMGGIKLPLNTSDSNLSGPFVIRKLMQGRLTVNGGSVTASGSSEEPGITGRWIEINAGLVSAYSGNGPGINGVTTTINGGTVMAAGGSSPYEFLNFVKEGYGKLKDTMNSSEDIKNSQEAALAFQKIDDMFKSWTDTFIGSLFGSGESGGGAGIGLYPGDSLAINNGIVIARGGPSSAGIGGSVRGGLASMFAISMDLTPGAITIKDGLVSATGGSGAAGIGGGYKQRAEGITVSGNPNVIATRGSDGAQDIGSGEGGPETLLKDHLGKALSYIRLEVKDKTNGQPLPDKKVTADGKSYFSNKDGLLGFFAPRQAQSRGKGSSSRTPAKIMVSALASSAFPGAVTEIIPSEQNIRSTIDLDFYLQNLALQGLTKDNPAGAPLQPSPAFDPQQANYALEVENMVTSLKVIPEAVSDDTVTVIQVNGSEVQAGEAAEVPLQIGENNILVTVALPAGEWADGAITLKKEHFIKVNRPNMKNLPLLALRESNQPLDEGSTFRAHYTLELPELVTSMPIQRIAIDRTTADSVVPAPAPDSGGNTPLSLADIWPGIWRGTVDYGDGSGLQVIALREDGSFNLEHRYGVGGDYPVKITLTYEDMGLVSGVQKVKVNYVAPRLMGMVGPPTSYEGGGIFSWLSPRPDKEINEGELLVLEGWVEDPGDNRWNLTVDYYDSMGPLAVELRSDKTFTISHRFYREPVNYIMVKVEDDTGLEDMRGISVAVHNVAPVVEAQLPALAQAGSLFRGAGSFADPGRDSWQGAVNYGDGSGPQPLVLKEDKTFELNHVYMTTGSFTVTVRVEDSDGGVGTASFSVKVKDYLFSLEAGADTSLNEGETLIRGVPVRGPLADLRGRVPEGIVQETKIQRITVDYGDGSAMETLTLGPVHQAGPPSGGEASAREIAIGYLSVIGGLNLNHTYADNGEYTVTVKLTDIDGDVYEDSFTAEAVNVAPTVQVDPVKDLIRGESFTLSGSIADPGADTWTAAIDFGDGGGNRELKLGSDKTFSASHTYNSSGYYTITVTVTDDDGGIGQAGQRVTVRNRGGGISADATLHSLVLAGVTLERKGPDPDDPDSLIPTGETGFDPQWFIYCISPGDPMVTTIIELTAHPLATISIDGVDWDGTPVPVDLASALVILVTAENGTTKTYTVSAD